MLPVIPNWFQPAKVAPPSSKLAGAAAFCTLFVTTTRSRLRSPKFRMPPPVGAAAPPVIHVVQNWWAEFSGQEDGPEE